MQKKWQKKWRITFFECKSNITKTLAWQVNCLKSYNSKNQSLNLRNTLIQRVKVTQKRINLRFLSFLWFHFTKSCQTWINIFFIICLFFYTYNYQRVKLVNAPALPEPSMREKQHFKNEAKEKNPIRYCTIHFYVTLTL